MNQHFFLLPDGRKLCYALYGQPGAKPVFYFHGTPGSRLEPLLLHVYNKNIELLLQTFGIRLIAVDRPGLALSDYNVNNSFRSFATDVSLLAAHLDIRSANVLGWSGAGTFILALAFHFPQLITGAFIITGFTKSFSDKDVFTNMHANKYYFGAAKYTPWLLRSALHIVGKKATDKPMPQWLSGLPEVDYELMKTPMVMRQFSTVTINEACRLHTKGAVQEAALYFKETGYDLSQIHQPIHYWWGTADNVVIDAHPKAVAEEAPNAFMHYKEGEGHVSIYVRYFEEVLATIAKQ